MFRYWDNDETDLSNLSLISNRMNISYDFRQIVSNDTTCAHRFARIWLRPATLSTPKPGPEFDILDKSSHG